MTPKRTTRTEPTAVRVVIVTLDTHLAGAAERARERLAQEIPGLRFSVHAASEWDDDPQALERCKSDIAQGDFIIASMLFLEDHFRAVLPALQARRDHCDAMIGCMSAAEIIRLTRLGRFSMNGSGGGAISLLKRLRGGNRHGASAGAAQMKLLRRIPQILRFIPGPAQDVRAYFLTLQYWLAGSDDNVVNMVRFLVDRYADGPRRALRGSLPASLPVTYPEVGLFHPRLRARITEDVRRLPAVPDPKGTVGVLVMRSYVLAGNTRHYEAVIAALEAKGLRVITAFAAGLDARPAVEKYFNAGGRPVIDALVSLTGFSLVGGPAYNDSRAAEELLAALDVPYIAAHPLEFQSLAQWQGGERGLTPVESTMMVAIPELDGATGPIVYAGRAGTDGEGGREMQPHPERVAVLAARVARLVALRATPRQARRVGIVLFNFPPNGGAVGTAAHLSVFASLQRTLRELRAAGYSVEVPEDEAALRRRLIEGNAARFGTPANVHARVSADEHVRRERWLKEIEAQWGPAPGRAQSDGSSVFVLGAQFGNVFVGIQPAFGYEGDPMRLLFERGFAPTHAFAAFYRYLREDFAADVVLHFGTHGALEFMPGKQVGMSGACWPDRLIGDLPNVYLYAANNPSEGALAKRRSAATLVSYLTPAISQAGLYRGLTDLKSSVDRFRALEPGDAQAGALAELIQAQGAQLQLVPAEPAWAPAELDAEVARVQRALRELEQTLIPCGLHEVGRPPSPAERTDLLLAVAESSHGITPSRRAIEALVAGESPQGALKGEGTPHDPAWIEAFTALQRTDTLLREDHELPAIVKALDGRFIRPAPGGDLLRSPAMLPTGRNVHGFDPFRIPSAFAVREGRTQAEALLERYRADGHALPGTIAMVLWGTDTLKTEGGPLAQALALMGAAPRFDAFGRLAGATLIPLAELGRPRIDVLVTVSGIFRDLLPLQMRLLAEAALLAAQADEPCESNYIRRHALAYQAQHGGDLESAALRVFGNADGAYGANVGHLIDSGAWDEEDEIAETYSRRKCFAYGRLGKPVKQPQLLRSVLEDVQLTYQNLDSVELGVTTLDVYFDTLGGIASAAHRATGERVPVYIGDQTRGGAVVRSLGEQVALETRTRTLNPKWYEEMLRHGYEGVRHIEAHVTNTLGWSATTGKVAPWVYERISETFVLDAQMRDRMAQLNPAACAKIANRLLEAHTRHYWTPDAEMLEALRQAGEDLEDRVEGIYDGHGVAA
ncbi:MAG: magnesium chelatase subunit H [Proteobacteria bacterium]|nr:magnesium chelatase subunit H [Pseudomonadota bacterium]